MPSPSESEYSPSLGSLGKGSLPSGRPSPSVSALLGLVPCAYSWAAVRPSLSASLLASPPLFGLRPWATSQPSGRPSPSLSALVISVPCCCSSALVRPSPSQSAPPSDGSRGSVPSPLTTDEAVIRTRNSATSMLRFFWLFIFISLPIFFVNHFREPTVLSFQDWPAFLTCSLGGSVASNACAGTYRDYLSRNMVRFHASTGLARLPYFLAVPCLCLQLQPILSRFILGNPVFPLTYRLL